MKLAKSKLMQIIKEELSLLGSLDIEENFVKKNEIQLNEDEGEVLWDAHKEALGALRSIAKRLSDSGVDEYEYWAELKKWFDDTVLEEG